MIERFENKIQKTDSCWNWIGAIKSNGYGNFVLKGKTYLAHRYSYEQHFGVIEHGMLVMHKCDNRRCVNPAHLCLGTQKDNVSDMILKGRARGVAAGSEHTPCAKLNNELVRRIRSLISSGIKHIDIAKSFGVSDATISYIASGKTWKKA